MRIQDEATHAQERFERRDDSTRELTIENGARLSSHERVCVERWGALEKQLAQMNDNIKFLTKQVWAAPLAALGALGIIIMWLVSHLFPLLPPPH